MTALNTGHDPEAGRGVLKSLSAAGRDYQLFGISYDYLSASLYEEGLMHRAFRFPLPIPGNEENFLENLASIKNTHGLDILIPNSDIDVPVMSEIQSYIRELNISVLLPTPEACRRIGKENLQLLRPKNSANWKHPKTWIVTPESFSTLKDLPVPCVIKNLVRGVSKASTRKELEILVGEKFREGQPILVVQELIKGEEFSIAVLADKDARLVGMVPIKKLLATKGGTTWMGVTVESGEFAHFVADLVSELGWTGPMDIEIIKDDQGEFYLIEINHRFPGWIYFASLAGINLVEIMVHLIQGKAIDRTVESETGLLFVRQAVDVVSDINRLGFFSLSGEMTYGPYQ